MGYLHASSTGLDHASVDTSSSQKEVFDMAKKQRKYTPEFRQQMVELVRAGRKFADMEKECRRLG
jgi:transposase-like protein